MIKKIFYEIREYIGFPHIFKSIDDEILIGCPLMGFTVEIPKEEWAPGLWVGTEGLKLTITKVDLENRKLTLRLK